MSAWGYEESKRGSDRGFSRKKWQQVLRTEKINDKTMYQPDMN